MKDVIEAAIRAAKRMGMSEQIVRYGARLAGSPWRMRRCFGGYQPTERDVFVAAYLKSGTNWTIQMALQIAHRGAAEFEHVHDLVPWPDTPSPGPIALDDPVSWQGSPTGLRVIKTHAPAEIVPYHPDARYLVTIRDPKEVMVSAYHFAAPLFGVADTLTPQDWLRIFTSNNRAGGSPWLKHTLGWWALRDRPNVQVSFYSEMKRDPDAAIRQTAALMGVALSDAERDAVSERCSLAYMKAHQSQFAATLLPFITPTHVPDMVRRGAAGGADELYSADELAAIDRSVLEGLAQRGSDFPYREVFGA